jgi:hypothetical protein
MTNKKISDLTATTTFSGSDLAVVVQSGATKKITAANMITAVSPSAATTSASGVVELATNAETATGTDTSRVVTPDDLRYGLANGVAQKIVLNGATGSSSNGDMNIGGSYLINGVAPNYVPPATVATFTASTALTITVDFTTYTTYKLILHIISTTAGSSLGLTASSNGGTSYATTAYNIREISGTGATSDFASGISLAAAGGMIDLTLSQIQTSAALSAHTNNSQSSTATQSIFIGVARCPITAAANRIKITPSSGNITGAYQLIPIGER